MPKQSLRTQFKAKRDSLTEMYKLQASNSINEALLALPQLESAQSVVGFFPYKGEPNIIPFLEMCLIQGKELYLPRVNGEILELVQVKTLQDVESGNFGINEPAKHLPATNITEFDLILIPGLVFATNGHRLGYGRGFYDKLLKRISSTKIGICYDFQIIELFESESHDVALDIIVSDTSTIICK